MAGSIESVPNEYLNVDIHDVESKSHIRRASGLAAGQADQSQIPFFEYNSKIIMDVMKVIQNNPQGSVISKPVRYGFTTSAILAADALDKCILIVAPTNKIIKETVFNANGAVIRVCGNAECMMLVEELEEYPILKKLPVMLPNCAKCKLYKSCKLMDLVREDNPKVIGITYAKLEAILLSEGKMAREMRDKLFKSVDIVMFDESHILSQPSLVTVPVGEYVNVNLEGYPDLQDIVSRWNALIIDCSDSITELLTKADKDGANQHLSILKINKNVRSSNEDDVKEIDIQKVWIQLKKLAVAHTVSDSILLTLNSMAAILVNETYSVSYITESEGQSGKVYISAGENSKKRTVSHFMQKAKQSCQPLFVSGTQYEPTPGFFSRWTGRELTQVAMPDTRNAGSKMLLIPDSYRLDTFNFAKRLPEILSRIREISEAEGNKPIYILVASQPKSEPIKDALKDLHNLTVDYYRSAKSIGVARNERVCITVGLAETPGNSCDPLTSTYEESRCLRKQGVQAASWQAINRVRDPEGLVESRVYFIGSRVDEIKQTSTWGTDRQILIASEGTWTAPDGVMHPRYTYEVTTSTEITPVHIQADARVNDKWHQARLKTSDFIQGIIIISENVAKVPILEYRGNGGVLGINKGGMNKNQTGNRVAQTIAGIGWLRGRPDIFAQQQRDGGYSKVLKHLDTDVLEAHVAGKTSVGTYQILEDDTVRWVAIDIDCHNVNDKTVKKAEEERDKAEWILDKYHIPYILEASGSPHSYHIWIILSPTKTYNAYRFIRQIASEAEIDSEVFPKQKSNDKTKYGNLIKLPYGKNLKNSNWSSYLDPDTDERIPCPATPPGIVRLLEVPKNVKAKSKTVVLCRASRPCITANSELDYCMTEALKEGMAFIGSPGHELRVAIATKSLALGWTEDKICDLFRAQPDFSEEITREQIRYIAGRDYHPYSCETLLDKCGSLIGVYCAGCRFKPKDILS